MAKSKAKQLQQLLTLSKVKGKLENLKEVALEVGWTPELKKMENRYLNQVTRIKEDLMGEKSITSPRRVIFLADDDYDRLSREGQIVIKKELVTERSRRSFNDNFGFDAGIEDFFEDLLGLEKKEDTKQYMETIITDFLG